MSEVPLLQVSQVTAVSTDWAGETQSRHWEPADGAGQRLVGCAALHVSLQWTVLSHLSSLSEVTPVIKQLTVSPDGSTVQLTVGLVQQAVPRLAVLGLQSRWLLAGLILLAGLSPGVGPRVPL